MPIRNKHKKGKFHKMYVHWIPNEHYLPHSTMIPRCFCLFSGMLIWIITYAFFFHLWTYEEYCALYSICSELKYREMCSVRQNKTLIDIIYSMEMLPTINQQCIHKEPTQIMSYNWHWWLQASHKDRNIKT